MKKKPGSALSSTGGSVGSGVGVVSGPRETQMKMRVRSEKGARVAFSAAENQYFAHMDIPASAAWTEVSAPMESELTGLNYVRAVVESGDVQIDWMTFE